MNKLNRAIDRFCILHPGFGIPNLMIYIVVSNIAVGLLANFSSAGAEFLQFFSFSLDGLLHGQVWRLVTFVFIPENLRPFWLFISCYFYYWIGSTLERQWGTAKFTVYYLGGMALTVLGVAIASILSGVDIPIYGAGYVNFAMFLAFASLFPDAQVLLFFIIPIRIKWLAYVDVAFFAFSIFTSIVSGAWVFAIPPMMALLNYVVCFYPELQSFVNQKAYQNKQAAHFRNTVHAAQQQEKAEQRSQGFHKRCCVCDRTDISNPELDFRYCSKCAGYHCFCSEHLFSHVHFTDENP